VEPIGYETKSKEAITKNNARPPTEAAIEESDRGNAAIAGLVPFGEEAKFMAFHMNLPLYSKYESCRSSNSRGTN
jgi:hypothetical protein